MALKTNKKVLDSTTEEKIKEAARKLFIQKGFAAVKVRDIAIKAGINLALVNYYFRSKEKLFEVIVEEGLQELLNLVKTIFNTKIKSLDNLIENLVDVYTDWILQNPDQAFFILNELKNNPKKFEARMISNIPDRAEVNMKFHKLLKDNKINKMDIFALKANLLGLLIAPYLVKHMFQADEVQFKAQIIARKKLIPLWLKAIIKIK